MAAGDEYHVVRPDFDVASGHYLSYPTERIPNRAEQQWREALDPNRELFVPVVDEADL